MAWIAAKLAKDRQFAQVLDSNSKAMKYLNQDFHTLRNECVEVGKLFQDPSFPTIMPSLGYKEPCPTKGPGGGGVLPSLFWANLKRKGWELKPGTPHSSCLTHPHR